MSRKTEMIILLIATIVISVLAVRSYLDIGLWRVATLCYLAGLACIIIGWIKHFNDRDE